MYFSCAQRKQKGFAPLVILVGIVFIGVAIGGAYYFGKSQALKPQTSSHVVTSPTPQATPTPSSTPDETANWGTYTNTEYGFSIEYPLTWEINDSKYKQDKELQKIIIEGSGANQSHGIFEIVILADDNLSLEQWITKNRNIYYLIKAGTQNIDKGDTILDGQQAKQFIIGHYSWPPDRVIISRRNRKIFIIRFAELESLEEVDLSEGYIKGYEQLRNLNNQILSTFKFIP